MKIRNLRSNDESGMASFLVVTLIVTLLALVSIGFSHLADREARQALDRQLSDEAYYAAESGVNDAYNYVSANPGVDTSSDTCIPPSVSPNPFASNGNLSSDGLIRYSCLSIVTKPKELTYNLQPGQSAVFPITSDQLDNLYFSWENQCYPGGGQGCNGTKLPLTPVFGQLPQEVAPNLDPDATGLLRVGIYPVPTAGSGFTGDTKTDIANVSKVYFLYPNGSDGHAGTGNYKDDTSGTMLDGKCNDAHPPNVLPSATPLYCNVEVTKIYDALNGGNGGNNHGVSTFYVSLTAKYQALTVLIQAETKDASNPDNCSHAKLLCLSGVEAIVDSTGAGNDVLRRIQAVIPLHPNTIPSYGLQSMQAICKLFRVQVPAQATYGTAQNDNAAPNPDGMCIAPSFSGGAIPVNGSP